MAAELAVWMSDAQVGTLALADGRLSFRYNPDWLAEPRAVALSCSLPLQAETFDDHQCRPFFAGLLPEGHLRRLIARYHQVSGQNDFALLTALGGECAGAISLMPATERPAPVALGDVQWLDEDRLMALLEELPHRPMLAGQDGLRLSLAGAQDKLPVVFDGQRIGLPLRRSPPSWIAPMWTGPATSTLTEPCPMSASSPARPMTWRDLRTWSAISPTHKRKAGARRAWGTE